MGGGAAEFKRGLSRDRVDIGDTAHAVGPENLGRLFHRLTETLRCQFVNGKVRSERASLFWRMLTIVVAQEDTFAFKTESDCVPTQRKFLQDLIALNNQGPILVFAFNDVAQCVVGAAERREIKPVHRPAERFVITELSENTKRVR